MPIWPIAPIAQRPAVTLRSWRVYEVPLEGDSEPWTRHFVGFSLQEQQGQVSSAIQSFDPRTRRARSRSGRVYELLHGPGANPDAQYVWAWWKDHNGVAAERDVSQEVQQAIEAAQEKAQDEEPDPVPGQPQGGGGGG